MVAKPEFPSAKDYATGQEVRWCPGCGDYAILKAVRKILANASAPREKTVFVSGIGCAARLPYYMATFGFHTIHGRAPAIATGIKLANPDLDVWVISGDGDSFSIGGNHFLHVLRRNVNLQILVFNNEVYGLTKGQYSPTSRTGMRTPSTPMGSVDYPVSGAALALGAGARFVARSVDTHQRHLSDVLERAHGNVGASFVEIFQNCIVYNDKVFADFTDKDVADEKQLHVRHGHPLVFGKDAGLGLRLKPGAIELEIVTIGENGVSESDLLVHDETNKALASMLVGLETPVALGVIYCDPIPSFDHLILAQVEEAKAKTPVHDLNELLRRAPTWTVDADPN